MPQSVTKKQLRSQVAATLTNTFDGLKNELSDKKFQRNIKRASKALLAGLVIKKPGKKTKKISQDENIAA